MSHVTILVFSPHRVALYSSDGHKMASSTGVDLLLQSNFDLEVNDVKYHVEIPSDCECIVHVSACTYCQ